MSLMISFQLYNISLPILTAGATDARASGDYPNHATPGLLGPSAGDRKRTVSICHGGSERSPCRCSMYAGCSISSRTAHRWGPDQRVRAGLPGVVWDTHLGHGRGMSGRTSPSWRGEELCWGEDDLAEAASADDSGVRGSAGCVATVCPMLHHDDDRGRLVPRQDQQHRVAAVGPVAARL
ncbi:hypothetical protein PIB30_095723 [Stylosanthes scabra]|uniref:Uncharacterized protein n=1 Tax=Stylosanthes scabra TaxID=79078 RepID=A0ABU6XWI4_9FABA|nr:hypothetical protein [Stylosanthes scabra]